MTGSEPQGLYDEDFYSWTQQQASALRALPPDAAIDIGHCAEEIEDLGKRDLREVMAHLGRVLQHLVKLEAVPNSRDAAHWHAEAVNFQMAASAAFSPSMRSLIDLEDAWTGGCRAARPVLKEAGVRAPSLEACPFTLDELLARDFDAEAAVERIATAMRSRGVA